MLEVICLATAIWYECRGCEDVRDQIAVGNVIMNRVEDQGEFEQYDSPCEVVQQPGHFPWKNVEPNLTNPVDRNRWSRIQDLAARIYNGDIEDLTDGALWFHHRRVSYIWTEGLERVRVGTGIHIFWREKEDD